MKLKTVVLFILILILFAGCSLLKNLQAPSWYYHPQRFALKGKVAFVGEGTAPTQRQAELLAYSNLQEKIELFIGSELNAEQYRRLTTLKSIEEYGFKVENFSIQNNKNGTYTYLLYATGSRDKLLFDMTEKAKDDAEKIDRVMTLVLEGDELVKKNSDLEGVEKYLQSMVLSYGLLSIDEEFSFSTIKDVVKEILLSVRIDISSIDRKNVTCLVSVRRKGFLLDSNVKNSGIKASYLASDSHGNVYEDSFEYLTSENGTFSYKPIDYTLVREGEIKFSFSFDNELAEIEKLDKYAADELRNVIEQRSVSFSYSRQYKKGPIVVCGIRFNDNGKFLESRAFSDSMMMKFDENFASCKVYYCSEDAEDADMVQVVSDSYPGAEYFLVYRAAVLDDVYSKTGVCVVSVQGEAKLYKLSDGLLVHETDMIYSNGFGNSFEEASDNAFNEMIQLIYSQIRIIYV